MGWKFIDAHENTELMKTMLEGVQKIKKCQCFLFKTMGVGTITGRPAKIALKIAIKKTEKIKKHATFIFSQESTAI